MTKSRRKNGPRANWSPENLEALARRFPHEKTVYLARDLGMRKHQVDRKAAKLGLKKTEAYKASPDACRLRQGDSVGVAHRFPKGHVPANKGLRRPGYAPGRMASTQFKKGELNGKARLNVKPIGYERIADGYLVRKINNDLPLQRRWKAVHRILWESANGPIPDGYIVRFKPGMKTFVAEEITLDRLEMITRRENMSLNTIHNYPKELAQIVQLRGAVQRKINRRLKNERPGPDTKK